MSTCYENGRLRAYLDGETSAVERSAIEAHLANCVICREELETLRSTAGLASALLSVPAMPVIDTQAALANIYVSARTDSTQPRRKLMETKTKRRWLAPIGALIVVLALLALPPVRAAADQVLQIFRVQAVVFVPVSQERMQQLQNLNFDGKSLFLAEPKITGEHKEPRSVATSEAAAAAVGFTLAQPSDVLADVTETSYSVTERTQAEFQVNVESARQLLQLTGVTDISLPDALGARPITVDMAPAAMVRYQTTSATIELMQGNAPQVSLPDGVELRDLGRAGLRILGMAPEQADALASQIDWSSTLVFPFPANLNSVRQVTINGAPGLLITAGGRSERQAQLYWQRGERFYVLQFETSDRSDVAGQIVRIAESVR